MQMCKVALYFALLLLEDSIFGYYCIDTTNEDQPISINLKTFNTVQKDMALDKDPKLIILKDGKQKFRYVSNLSTTSGQPNKRWKLERVTQKQYEVINMLWRKTKIFVDEDIIDTTKLTKIDNATNKIEKRIKYNNNRHNLIIFSANTPSLHTTTPSKIEFYYFDDTLEKANEQLCVEASCKQAIAKTISSKVTSDLPFLIYHLKSRYAKPKPATLNALTSVNLKLFQQKDKITDFQSNQSQKDERKKKKISVEQNYLKNKVKNKLLGHVTSALLNKRVFRNTTVKGHTYKSSMLIDDSFSYVDQVDSKSTTIYDKIKFFELYDQYTREPDMKKLEIKGRKTKLEKVDKGSNNHQASHGKNHLRSFRNFNRPCCRKPNEEHPESSTHQTHHSIKRKTNETAYFLNGNLSKSMQSESKLNISYENKPGLWSEYPFAAVYTYEPLQVHCDAAAINTHWLVASGSCLSRVNKKPYGGGRSAFVAYCGDQWWQPERVAYVKYSIVHPSFHPRDKTRKHLYNIGVIQVVSSMMSACAGWAPVPLMSHQFAADTEGSWALAVGWGLDRFDRKYGATDLPRTPLMTYKGILYFDTCPGNIRYSKAMRLADGGGVQNIHCLSLPPYSGEESDPVHGGLLLVEGKLIALYLQEERRRWGEQSAHYTGIWRLIPWVMDMAKEPDEIDTFIFEI